MSRATREINAPDIVHELIDGEAIMINMTTGSYYSLDGVGAVVWEALQQGPADEASIAAVLEPVFGANGRALEAEVGKFLDELESEALLRPAAEAPVALRPIQREAEPFTTPVLHKYTDLEALLLIDPIHDVTTQGWPNVSKADQA
jgi:hypothetical protein